jgi:ABC-2 type transport system ATP-binding protein
MAADMAVVRVEDVTKRYRNVTALDGVSIEIEAGDFYGFFGPNGAGKTTLLKILTGQLRQTSGSVNVLGIDVAKEPLKVKAVVGIVPEVESPPSYLTAFEYLYFVSRVRKIDDANGRIKRWIDFFGLEDSRGILCKDLSKGNRQKLMIASALIHEPRLLFMDEPFINLDPVFQRRLKDHLSEYSRGGGTVFMCSHLLQIAEKLCDRVAVINKGRIIAEGSLAQVRGGSPDLEQAFLHLVEGDG